MSQQLPPSATQEVRRTPAEAAQQIGVKESTLAAWRHTGKNQLPYLRIAGRVMYRQSDLDAFLRAHTTQHGEVSA